MEMKPLSHRQERSMEDPFQDAPLQEDGNSGELDKLQLWFHRDFLKRDTVSFNTNEKFLNLYDGSLCDLEVQTSRSVQRPNSKATWYRTELRNGSPWMIRVSNWAMSRELVSTDEVRTNTSKAALRWVPACIALALLVSTDLDSLCCSEGR